MIKVLFILFVFLFIIEFGYSLEVGISPAYININVNSGETQCRNITIYSSQDKLFTGVIKLSEKNSRNINDYNLFYNENDISINYIKNIKVSKQEKVNFCVSGIKSGKYYGALLYSTDKTSVGIWININVNENKNQNEINSMAVKNISENKNYLIVIPTIFLAAILIYLFYLKNKIKISDV